MTRNRALIAPQHDECPFSLVGLKDQRLDHLMLAETQRARHGGRPLFDGRWKGAAFVRNAELIQVRVRRKLHAESTLLSHVTHSGQAA
jgi:hypothetical protein